MARETAKFLFFDVDKCGFYSGRQGAPSFGGLDDMLEDLFEWSQGLSLAETQTFTPAADGNLMPVYLLDIQRSVDGWLVVTWNEVPSTAGAVASVDRNSRVGRADVTANEIPDGGIPGFATYFYFVPSRNVFCSIRFQHANSGQPGMRSYMDAFLSMYSKYAVTAANGRAIDVKGYRQVGEGFNYEENQYEPVIPRFITSLHKVPGHWDFIRENLDDVRKVVRKTTLNLDRAEDLSTWQVALRWANLGRPEREPDKVRVVLEIASSVTQHDFDMMTAEWEARNVREVDDTGFVMKGSSEVHWLSKSSAKAELEIDVERLNFEVVDSISLLRAIEAFRGHLLGLL